MKLIGFYFIYFIKSGIFEYEIYNYLLSCGMPDFVPFLYSECRPERPGFTSELFLTKGFSRKGVVEFDNRDFHDVQSLQVRYDPQQSVFGRLGEHTGV